VICGGVTFFSDIVISEVDNSVRDQVEYLLEKATQLLAEGKTAEEVAVQLSKRLTQEEAIHLRAEFSKQETKRISKKLKVESEFPKGQFNEFNPELKKISPFIFGTQRRRLNMEF
jgi:hypothetical protein